MQRPTSLNRRATPNSVFMIRLIQLLAILAGVLLVFVAVLTCVDVLARVSGMFAIPWTLDVSASALYLATFLGAPWVVHEYGSSATASFVRCLPDGMQHAGTRWVNLAGMLLCLVLGAYATRLLLRAMQAGNVITEPFAYAQWTQYAVPVLIFALLAYLFYRYAQQSPRQ